MIYKNWMSYIKDDVKITKMVMPGAHNAGSSGMARMGCCQSGDMYEQFACGVRHFCIRLDTDKKGRLILKHGVVKGKRFTIELENMRRMLAENDSEFFIFDIREYYTGKFGPFYMLYKADAKAVDALVREYLSPEKYAFTDFDDISTVTMGDIRKSGKRYLLYNYEKAYDYSVACPYIFPLDNRNYGLKAPNMIKEAVTLFDLHQTEGFFWFQTQGTPNFKTEAGMRSPKKLDNDLRPYFKEFMGIIANNPHYLESANIIEGDFMSGDTMKAREILLLNILKNNVREDLIEEYRAGLA